MIFSFHSGGWLGWICLEYCYQNSELSSVPRGIIVTMEHVGYGSGLNCSSCRGCVMLAARVVTGFSACESVGTKGQQVLSCTCITVEPKRQEAARPDLY